MARGENPTLEITSRAGRALIQLQRAAEWGEAGAGQGQIRTVRAETNVTLPSVPRHPLMPRSQSCPQSLRKAAGVARKAGSSGMLPSLVTPGPPGSFGVLVCSPPSGCRPAGESFGSCPQPPVDPELHSG